MPLFLLLFVAVVVFYSPHLCISSSSPSSPTYTHLPLSHPHLNVSYTLIVEIQIRLVKIVYYNLSLITFRPVDAHSQTDTERNEMKGYMWHVETAWLDI